jgi:hypothetical protein
MKSRNHVTLRPVYVSHDLLELTEAYVFFLTAEHVCDKMAVVFLTRSFHHALSVLCFKRSDSSRNVYEAYWDYSDG